MEIVLLPEIYVTAQKISRHPFSCQHEHPGNGLFDRFFHVCAPEFKYAGGKDVIKALNFIAVNVGCPKLGIRVFLCCNGNEIGIDVYAVVEVVPGDAAGLPEEFRLIIKKPSGQLDVRLSQEDLS